MTVLDNFTLEHLPGKIHKLDFTDRFFNFLKSSKKNEWQDHPAHSKVLFDGKPTGVELAGTELKAQFGHRDGYVLFTAYDYYDGEEIYISFLNFNFEVIDELTLDGVFSRTGFASDFKILSTDKIEFSIYGEKEKRRLTVSSPPTAEFPTDFAELTARSLSRHLSKHYLKLETENI